MISGIKSLVAESRALEQCVENAALATELYEAIAADANCTSEKKAQAKTDAVTTQWAVGSQKNRVNNAAEHGASFLSDEQKDKLREPHTYIAAAEDERGDGRGSYFTQHGLFLVNELHGAESSTSTNVLHVLIDNAHSGRPFMRGPRKPKK